MKKLEPSYVAGGNVKWGAFFGKHFNSSSEKLNVKLSFDPTVLVLKFYSKFSQDSWKHVPIKTNAHVFIYFSSAKFSYREI